MKVKKQNIDELRPEYDFDYSKAARGKYCRRLQKEGFNVIILEPDQVRAFQEKNSGSRP